MNTVAGDVNDTYYCCGRCRGLWPIHRQLQKHKHLCIGDITLSDCDKFACDKSLYLKYLSVENAETLEETTPTRAVLLQHDPCDDDEDCGEAVHIKMVRDMAAESDVNVAENNAEAESVEMAPRRGRRKRVPWRWRDLDVDVASPHKRQSKKQSPGLSGPMNVKDISSSTIARGVLSELGREDQESEDQTAKSNRPEVKMSEVASTINSLEQFESSSDTVARTCHSEARSTEQGKPAEDDNCGGGQYTPNGCVGDTPKNTRQSLPHRDESESDVDLTTVSQRQTRNTTRKKQTTRHAHTRQEQQVSYNEHVVIEAYQAPSGKTSTQAFYKCPTCAWRTKHVGFFARHMRVSHDDGRAWACDQCAFTCMSKKQMTKHTNQHTRPFLCDYCSVRFSEQRELERHIWMHKGEFPFCCSECDYKTRFSKALKEHVRKHTGEKLRCSEPGCEFATNYQYALSAHRAAKHAAEKRFACAACAYRTSDKGSFTKHTKLHLGLKDYKCGECDYRAVTRYDIVKHMRRHTKEKLYFCDRCDYSTSYSSGLRLHLMTHLGVKPWQCSLCGYNSVTRSKIVRHIRQRHADSPQGGSVIDLGLKLDMRARDYRQRSRPLPAVVTEDAPVEEVQYELLDIPLTMLEGAEVSVTTTTDDTVVDGQTQSHECCPEDTVLAGAELTLITTTAM